MSNVCAALQSSNFLFAGRTLLLAACYPSLPGTPSLLQIVNFAFIAYTPFGVETEGKLSSRHCYEVQNHEDAKLEAYRTARTGPARGRRRLDVFCSACVQPA